jgi:hypothetical protein
MEFPGRLSLWCSSRFKAECAEILEDERTPGMVTVTLRPATVCGYAPRQRLDVIVNILTMADARRSLTTLPIRCGVAIK